MSEKSSEYHKKTCIICGCHTNQTINIYEPRSGPNIVRLIQARFKFQPLNEDKYLCYSCNNWLINWHSLQALNSNDADNPSGTYRSSQMNNMVSEEAVQSEMEHNKQQQSTKPVAQVQPQPRHQTDLNCLQLPKRTPHQCANTKKPNGYFNSKRTFQIRPRFHTNQRKSLHICCICGRTILRRKSTIRASCNFIKCKKCRKILQWRSMYLNSLLLRKKYKRSKALPAKQKHVGLVNEEVRNKASVSYEPRLYQKPLVDGKIVAMLRRLGTTLSRDDTTTMPKRHQPQIMSPTKKKPQIWTRSIMDDEILINFNTAITEVLPIRHIRRKLTYHVSDFIGDDAIEIRSSDEENEAVDEDDKTTKVNFRNVYSSLPKGLTVSLISNTEPDPADLYN